MSTTPRIIAVIPARLASTRLPRKVLRLIAGEPMLAWVYRAVRACARLDDVIIATDSPEVLSLATENGWKAMLTPLDCASGTDRVHHVAQTVPGDIYVNVQGDEPLLLSAHIDALLEPFLRPRFVPADESSIENAVFVSTLATPCPAEDILNPNVVKVTLATNGRALYFSRAAIPYDRDRTVPVQYLKHLGLYAYRKGALDRFPTLEPSALEAAERLEQLRFLENGIDIHVAITRHNTVGVDTEQDLQAVEAILSARR